MCSELACRGQLRGGQLPESPGLGDGARFPPAFSFSPLGLWQSRREKLGGALACRTSGEMRGCGGGGQLKSKARLRAGGRASEPASGASPRQLERGLGKAAGLGTSRRSLKELLAGPVSAASPASEGLCSARELFSPAWECGGGSAGTSSPSARLPRAACLASASPIKVIAGEFCSSFKPFFSFLILPSG